MRRLLTILFLLLYFTSTAQKVKKQHVELQDAQLQAFVKAGKQLHYIEFQKNDIEEIKLKPDSLVKPVKYAPYGNWYDFDFLGDKYLLEKQFGEFPENIFLKKLDSLAPKNSEYTRYEGKIYADHIDIHIHSHFSTKRSPVFRRVRHEIEFPGGRAGLTQYLQSKIPAGIELLPPGTDSALFFTAKVMRKDSLVHEVKPLDSTVSRLSGIIQAALTGSRWTPPYAGGIQVNGYTSIYVRLRKDGTIEADYRR